ncbi:tetratricopeptide repeat protein [Marinoscillum pacificum]|uniref:tetratricopeptide repeat protein n=1 Tax=Marinoscillum pacificum TaxID=392723 RepID=UPI0021578217|nr:tetratricopeptide repeat protein [Marinoscillum pacificum]
MYTRKFLIIITLLGAALSLSAQTDDAKLANEYFQQGEFEKARAMFEDLEKNRSVIPLIHANYFRLLLEEQDIKGAEKYLDRVIKSFPGNINYQVDLAFLYHTIGESDKLDKYLSTLKKQFIENQYQLSSIAQNLVSHQMYEEAIDFYLTARKLNGRESAFALDMAALYRMKNDKRKMTEEYINYAEGNPANLAYVKNLFQNILTEPEDQEFLEETLIQKIQKDPNSALYSDLLIWLELQRKNYYAAFIQARALDRRNQQPGDQSMRIARIAYDNESWDDAIDIYTYVIDTYGDDYNYPQARRFLIKSKENKVKTAFPVDTTAIRNLATEYSELYDQIGPNYTTLEALRNKALLHAFYLDELDTATRILNFVIENRRAPRALVSECKLDLGDIYILTGEPWESTLLYSQVEKDNKEAPLGYEAKLRNARLNYFTGNFALAKSHLDILKLATTREISNDAIALSLLITDNTAFDTTDFIMQEFANVELLIFQNKTAEAKAKLAKILKENPGHSITDEVYWLQSKLELQAGNYQQAVDYLDKIIQAYSYDILSDDAFYKKATIVQDYLHDEEQAMTLYQEFLKAHPGSMYVAEARQRIRQIRGDLVN